MLIPIVLSGGTGSRLWPASREAKPKPFMKMAQGRSLLELTYERARAIAGGGEVVTVTNREYLFMSRDEYGRDRAPCAFLLEPFGRNTAPAIAMAALRASHRHGEDSVLVVLPADHLIADTAGFLGDVGIATALAKEGFLVTFGVPPSRPETGYGYIELGEALGAAGAFRARRFVEKPDLERAREYVARGDFLWNSGMFCFTAGNFLATLGECQPELRDRAQDCWRASVDRQDLDAGILELDADTFGLLRSVSVDIAVMESARNVAVVRAGFDWSDVGSWDAVHEVSAIDPAGNCVVGEAVLIEVSNTYIQSDGRLVAAVGIDNLVIVDTPDAILVSDRCRTQDVKKVVEQLKLRNHESAVTHRTVTRPWGTYTVLDEGPGFKIKRIVVKPGASLSLQMHHHRSEHWVVVSGTANVRNGEREVLLRENESTYIPAGNVHRLSNPGRVDLAIIEVQCGGYLGEDDIVRFDDAYGRAVPAAGGPVPG